MKYIETKGKEPINWLHELQLKMKSDSYGIPQYKLMELSKDWVTCACGNQCDVIARYHHGAPYDGKLADLGMDFYYLVRDWDWRNAINKLHEIEARTWHLIQNVYTYQPMIVAPLL